MNIPVLKGSKMKLSTTIALLVTLYSMNTFAEDVKEIKFKSLPLIVQQRILQQTAVTSIQKVELIFDEGTTKYEVESNNNGLQKDITVAENGDIIEIEQSTTLNKLSQKAQAAIKKDYPDLKIDEIESAQSFYTAIEGTAQGKKVIFKVFATGDIEDRVLSEKKSD